MFESYPSKSLGRIFTLGVMIGAVLMAAALIYLIISEPINILSFLWVLLVIATVPAVISLGIWRDSMSNARYRVEKLVLEIHWGRIIESVPLKNIQEMSLRGGLEEIEGFRGLIWPGFLTGSATLHQKDREIPSLVFSTSLKDEGLMILTESRSFLISPADPEDFKTCIEALQKSPDSTAPADIQYGSALSQNAIWSDRLGQVLISAPIILNLFLFGLIAGLLGKFQEQVPLHFDSSGSVDRYGLPINLLVLPLIGLIAWLLALVEGVYFYFWRDERPVALIIWGTTLVIEIATWIAVLLLIP